MAKNLNEDAQIMRMKALMNYGLTENKQPAYSTVEYSKVAADGKLYGIVREGSNYFIKTAKNVKGGLVSENFDYIGGFRNRKDNMFESFASAQRYFGEKMININESIENVQKQVIAENYIDEKKEVIEEGTKKMQAEIARQRQIMSNAQNIMEGKKQDCCCPVVGKDANKNCESPKTDAKKADVATDYHGKPIKKTPGAPFTEGPKMTNESTETPLSSRENPDYMDKSHGTKIGNSAPFDNPKEKVQNAVADENGGESESNEQTSVVNEAESMHNSQNQNSPAVGVSDKGDTAPFDEKAKVNESLDDFDDDLDDDDVDTSLDDDMDGDLDTDMDADVDMVDADADTSDTMDSDIDGDVDVVDDINAGENDMESRMAALESKIDTILDAINNMKYDDDDTLYDDDDVDTDSDMMDDDAPIDDDDEYSEDDEIVESRSYRAMRRMNEENRLDDFGKHPAYQKKVMTLPSNTNMKRDGQYDMNDSSVDGEQPYGTQKGNTAPFEAERERIENEITEAVFRALKKKLV